MILRTVLTRLLGVFILFWFVGAALPAIAQIPCTGKDVLTAKSCQGDSNSTDEQALFQLVTRYRSANGRPQIRLSPALSMVANRHLIDLMQNVRAFTHSWSNCPYDIAIEKTWHCVSEAPRRLNSGYTGQGFETLYRTTTGNATPASALEAWKKNALHNSIILTLNMFKDMAWDEVGVAVDGPYAVLWFGSPPGKNEAAASLKGLGLGVSYDQAVAGLSKLMTIDQTSSSVENNKWQGFTADKGTKLEIFGSRKDITEASVAISMKLGTDGKMSSENQKILVTLLGNLFPEWSGIDDWITRAVAAIAADRSASRTKLVRKNTIEFRSDAPNSFRLRIAPESKQKYFEV